LTEPVPSLADDTPTAVDGHSYGRAPRDPDRERLAEALRRVQAEFMGTLAPPELLQPLAHHLELVADQLAPYSLTAVPADSWQDLNRTAATRTLAPELTDVEFDQDHLSAMVTFSTFYTGGNGAVHGGALPLLFDQILGGLSQFGRSMCRTAYLNVDYRRVTPVGKPLRVEGRYERTEGRKRFLYGAIYDGEHVTAEAHGLFVELRAGQA
jgi:acyl-coenzyme A thioesterase PaaI-like protein